MKKRRVCIVGDIPLVVEFAALFLEKGFAVDARTNTSGAVELPHGIRRIVRPSQTTNIAVELTNIDLLRKRRNLAALESAIRPGIPLLSSSVTMTVAEQAEFVRHPRRLLGIGALPSLLQTDLIELAASAATSIETTETARQLFLELGKETALVVDSAGMVFPRILCALANEACHALGDGVAAQDEIDTAMKLGTNYPAGPLEWADRIGYGEVFAVMSSMQKHFDEDRYRPAPLLAQRALAARSKSTRPGAPQARRVE